MLSVANYCEDLFNFINTLAVDIIFCTSSNVTGRFIYVLKGLKPQIFE